MHSPERDSPRRKDHSQQALRILFLEPQPCIRALKYAIALKGALKNNVGICLGHLGHTLTELYGFGEEYFDQVTRLSPGRLSESLRRVIEEYEPQVIHSHNAPDTLTVAALGVAEDIPIIHDIHELLSVHNSGFFSDDDKERLVRYRRDERRACEESDGGIYATEEIGRYVHQQYNVGGQPSIVFPNYASESVMPHHFKEKISTEETHMVYVGCITNLVEGSHYDLREIFKGIANCNLHIHFYPSSNHITRSNSAYRRLARSNRFMHCHDHLGYRELLYEMTQYDFGWAGFNGAKNAEHLDLALQNKVFDYLSSGLPIITFPHRAIQRFIEEYGVGLIVKDVDELPELLRNVDVPKLRDRAMKTRRNLTFRSKIPKLLDFYDKVAGTKGD